MLADSLSFSSLNRGGRLTWKSLSPQDSRKGQGFGVLLTLFKSQPCLSLAV